MMLLSSTVMDGRDPAIFGAPRDPRIKSAGDIFRGW
jgi:hypothetical protein